MYTHFLKRSLLCFLLIFALTIPLLGCNNILGTPTDTPTEQPTEKPTEQPTEAPAPEIKKWDEFKVSDYTIKKIGNKWYIEFDDPSRYEAVTLSGDRNSGISFSSIDDFVNAVMNGALTIYDKQRIIKRFPRDNVGIIVCDFNNIYTPKVPEELSNILRCTWSGNRYSVAVGSNDCIASFLNKDEYNDYVDSRISYYILRDERLTLIKTEKFDNFNLESSYYGFGENPDYAKIIISSYEIDGQKFLLREEFINSDTNGYYLSSLSLSSSNGDCNFVYEFYNFTERPSIEYLSQFGAEHYVNTAYEGE